MVCALHEESAMAMRFFEAENIGEAMHIAIKKIRGLRKEVLEIWDDCNVSLYEVGPYVKGTGSPRHAPQFSHGRERTGHPRFIEHDIRDTRW